MHEVDERPPRTHREGLEQLANAIIGQDTHRLEWVLRQQIEAQTDEDDDNSARLLGEFQTKSGPEVESNLFGSNVRKLFDIALSEAVKRQDSKVVKSIVKFTKEKMLQVGI